MRGRRRDAEGDGGSEREGGDSSGHRCPPARARLRRRGLLRLLGVILRAHAGEHALGEVAGWKLRLPPLEIDHLAERLARFFHLVHVVLQSVDSAARIFSRARKSLVFAVFSGTSSAAAISAHRKAMDLGEHESSPLIVGKLRRRLGDRLSELAPLERDLRRRAGRSLAGLVDLLEVEATALARVERETRRDREEPGRDLGGAFGIEARERPVGANERLLGEVLDLGPMPEHPREQREHHPLVADDERAEGHGVLRAAARDEGRVERRGSARRTSPGKGDAHGGESHHRPVSRRDLQKVPGKNSLHRRVTSAGGRPRELLDAPGSGVRSRRAPKLVSQGDQACDWIDHSRDRAARVFASRGLLEGLMRLRTVLGALVSCFSRSPRPHKQRALGSRAWGTDANPCSRTAPCKSSVRAKRSSRMRLRAGVRSGAQAASRGRARRRSRHQATRLCERTRLHVPRNASRARLIPCASSNPLRVDHESPLASLTSMPNGVLTAWVQRVRLQRGHGVSGLAAPRVIRSPHVMHA